MGNSSPSLPIVSLSPFLNPSPSPEQERELHSAAAALNAACTTTGFFYLTDHGIPPAKLGRTLDLARAFFLGSSAAAKARLARSQPDGARGYQRLGENVTQGRRDAHEAVDFYREWADGDGCEGGLLSGKNLWPDEPAELESEMQSYIEDVLKVGSAVVKAMGIALGLEDTDLFVKATDRSFWVFRMIGYPGLKDDDEGISCGEHTEDAMGAKDYGCVTLLLADSTKGALQVRAKDGRWIDADPIPGAFVVNIGDMMERWTNGLWKSTLHRVIHSGTNHRISVPFFFEPNFDAEVKPLSECVKRTGGQALYENTVYGQHLIGKIKGNFY